MNIRTTLIMWLGVQLFFIEREIVAFSGRADTAVYPKSSVGRSGVRSPSSCRCQHTFTEGILIPPPVLRREIMN